MNIQHRHALRIRARLGNTIKNVDNNKYSELRFELPTKPPPPHQFYKGTIVNKTI